MTKLLQHLFIRDWLLKVFSLALAVLTWLAVSFSLRQQVVEVPGQPTLSERTYYDLQVLVMSREADVHGYQVKPSEVDVTVQGEEPLLSNLQGSQLRVLVDLTGAEATNAIRRRLEVITPPGITHRRIEPAEVEINPAAVP